MFQERIIGANSYGWGGHFQTPWWAGFNDARGGLDYHNPRALLTSRYEYQQGYLTGTEECK